MLLIVGAARRALVRALASVERGRLALAPAIAKANLPGLVPRGPVGGVGCDGLDGPVERRKPTGRR